MITEQVIKAKANSSDMLCLNHLPVFLPGLIKVLALK
jgi:hypothetical protein